jgi:hypothetical protein
MLTMNRLTEWRTRRTLAHSAQSSSWSENCYRYLRFRMLVALQGSLSNVQYWQLGRYIVAQMCRFRSVDQRKETMSGSIHFDLMGEM